MKLFKINNFWKKFLQKLKNHQFLKKKLKIFIFCQNFEKSSIFAPNFEKSSFFAKILKKNHRFFCQNFEKFIIFSQNLKSFMFFLVSQCHDTWHFWKVWLYLFIKKRWKICYQICHLHHSWRSKYIGIIIFMIKLSFSYWMLNKMSSVFSGLIASHQ